MYSKRVIDTMNRRSLSAILIVLVGVAVLSYFVFFKDANTYADPELEFPILEPERIERISAYRTPDWGEPGVFHNGIDLVISDNVTIVSPADGTVVRVSENVNPYAGNVLFDVTIRINPAWAVHLVLEPGFLDEANNSLQSDNILVSINDVLEAGDVVGTLLSSESYPHLHYMLMNLGSDVCVYNYSSQAAQDTFDEIALRSSSVICYPLGGQENLDFVWTMERGRDDNYLLLT
jgi:murein DD-endopeptidase MepM/ murein hydrolase activator NlpD